MKYEVVNMKTGLIKTYGFNSDEMSDRDKLDSIDDKVIEAYIREKKLKRLNKLK